MPESAASGRPRIGQGAFGGVTEEMIDALVHSFYAKIRTDPVLGPIFGRVIREEDWPTHLTKMCDFWSSALLLTERFRGAPMPAHIRIPDIGPGHFARWLDLFRQTAAEVCPPEAADIFVSRAEAIAQSLQMSIAVSRGNPPLAQSDTTA
jgi:hemoglobin